jgi:phosphate transport system substrate-binding protein
MTALRQLSGGKMKYHWLCGCAVVLVTGMLSADASAAREQIRIAGSSTVFPFVSQTAEEFGKLGKFKTPIVESTGTGGGFKLFCEGVGDATTDISNASRPIKDSEKKLCAKHGVTDIEEFRIGFDGIVIAKQKKTMPIALTIKQLFLALAKQVPVAGVLKDNPYKTWHDVDASLPNTKIEVYGPPPTSGTRDAFVEIVMEKGCAAFSEFEKAYPDKEKRKKTCHVLREDGGFVDAGENDNIIVQKLMGNPDALGIFGYSFMLENMSLVQASPIEGVMPDFEDIISGKYPVARSLYVYLKKQHLGMIAGLKEFLIELTSPEAMGEDGYLIDAGLIPLPADQQQEVRTSVEKL